MVRRVPPVRRLSERGMGRTGCMVWLLLLVAGGYFAVEVGSVYLRYWRLEDEMRTQAQFAPNLSDETIQRRLLLKVEELGLPEEAKRITVRRTSRPREILISLSYEEVVQFPFITRTLRFHPEVRQRL